jgi:hypothetical protein
MTRGQAYKDLFLLLCGELPPVNIGNPQRLTRLDEATYERLQHFIADKLRLQWATGIGVIEAMDHIVEEAVGNSEMAFAQATPVLFKVRRSKT